MVSKVHAMLRQLLSTAATKIADAPLCQVLDLNDTFRVLFESQGFGKSATFDCCEIKELARIELTRRGNTTTTPTQK